MAGTCNKTNAYRCGKGKGNNCWKGLKDKIKMVLVEMGLINMGQNWAQGWALENTGMKLNPYPANVENMVSYK